MLNNDHLKTAIGELVASALRFGRDLARLEDLEPLTLAGGLIEVEKLKDKLAKVSGKVLNGAEVKPGREKKGDQKRLFGKDPKDDPPAA